MEAKTESTIDLGKPDAHTPATRSPTIAGDTRARLGSELRSLYAVLCDAEPITDTQVDLLLRLRHRERDRLRVA